MPENDYGNTTPNPFTNDQISSFGNDYLSGGGTWDNLSNIASSKGVTSDQLTGAGLWQGMPTWMNSLNSQIAKDPTQTSWKDPTSGLTYMTRNNSGWDDGQGMYSVGQYKPNGTYNIYDSMGKDTGKTGQYGNPNADTAYLIAMAAMAAGGIAAGGGLGGAGAGTGGGTLAGDATLPGSLGVDGLGGGGGATFNAAADSQLASSQLGLTAADVSGSVPGAVDLGTAGGVTTTGLDAAGNAIAPGAPPGAPPGTPGAPPPGGGLPKIPGIPGIPGGGSGGGNGDIGLKDIINLIGGGIDSHNQNKASDDMLNYLKGQQDKIDKLYSPGSPEYNYLSQQIDRKDAAAGRMSQYGPRSTDLAARIAQIKSDETVRMTQGVGNLYRQSLNQKAAAPTGLLTSLDSLSKKLGLSTDNIATWLGNHGLSKMFDSNGARTDWTPDTSTISNADNYLPDGGDLGQYL